MKINTQYHPTARVKIRRKEMYAADDTSADCPFNVYQLFEKGPGANKRTTWIYKSDITLKDAIAAVFIGGAAVSGGVGTVIGSMVLLPPRLTSK